MASFLAMLVAQYELQTDTYGHDFVEMNDGDHDEERAAFVRDNVLAATDELHEALQEVGWKPWASSRHMNKEPYLGELVDVFHFLMNLLLVTGVHPQALADEFSRRYFAKNARNAERQVEGYTGAKEKCPACGRDTAETQLTERFDVESGIYTTVCFCGKALWRSETPA
jgi:phosphoribosyl-ATP pyrophosphohydrolase